MLRYRFQRGVLKSSLRENSKNLVLAAGGFVPKVLACFGGGGMKVLTRCLGVEGFRTGRTLPGPYEWWNVGSNLIL